MPNLRHLSIKKVMQQLTINTIICRIYKNRHQLVTNTLYEIIGLYTTPKTFRIVQKQITLIHLGHNLAFNQNHKTKLHTNERLTRSTVNKGTTNLRERCSTSCDLLLCRLFSVRARASFYQSVYLFSAPYAS